MTAPGGSTRWAVRARTIFWLHCAFPWRNAEVPYSPMRFKKSENYAVGALVACLEHGGTVATDVYDPEQSKAARPVSLQAGDQECSGCGTLINTDEFPGADWANILANQRLKYGHTMCRECHQEVQDCD